MKDNEVPNLRCLGQPACLRGGEVVSLPGFVGVLMQVGGFTVQGVRSLGQRGDLGFVLVVVSNVFEIGDFLPA